MNAERKLLALELVRERKISELLPGAANEQWEASGVCVGEGYFYVIFDNSPHIARLAGSLTVGDPANILLRQRGQTAGFEDITYHERERRFLILIEALALDECYKPLIEEYDDDFRFIQSLWVDFPLQNANKGMEGITYVCRDGQDYVLCMCEGNKCKSGRAGRKPGGGRIHIFQRGKNQWKHAGVIKLPPSVLFKDYACLDVDGNQVAVVSQRSAALWIGAFQESGWDFVDEGVIYPFPKNEKGKVVYGNVEGVGWITPTQIVVVSDKYKPGEQPSRCRAKDQSIHVFNLPTP